MKATASYIRTETIFSTIGTIVASVLAFLLVFGLSGPVPVRGIGAYAFDFGPQSFMTALLCIWLPGVITRKRIGRGAVLPAPGAEPRIASLFVRGLTYGLVSLVLTACPVALTLLASGTTEIGWTAALAGKIIFGAVLAMITTPIGLHAVLQEPMPRL